MDFESAALLEWWANSSFVLTTSVRVEVTAVPDGWLAQVTADSADDFWGLVAFGNPYRLRFADGSAFEVGLGDPDDSGVFPLWDWQLEGDRQRPCPECGSPLTRTETVVAADNTVIIRDTCSGCGREFARSVSPKV